MERGDYTHLLCFTLVPSCHSEPHSMAIISREPRIASLIALGDVRTLCFDRKRFEGLLRERPETCLAVMKVLGARLKELSK